MLGGEKKNETKVKWEKKKKLCKEGI